MIELFEGKVSIDASTFTPFEIDTLVSYKEELIEYQREQREKQAKEAEKERKRKQLGFVKR